jgi:hypothetical protein
MKNGFDLLSHPFTILARGVRCICARVPVHVVLGHGIRPEENMVRFLDRLSKIGKEQKDEAVRKKIPIVTDGVKSVSHWSGLRGSQRPSPDDRHLVTRDADHP